MFRKNCTLWPLPGIRHSIAHSIELDELYKNMKKFLCGNEFWPSYGHMKIEKLKGPPLGVKSSKKFSDKL